MKQKMIYTVLVLTGLYMHAETGSCPKAIKPSSVIKTLQIKEKNTDASGEAVELPVLPLSKMLFRI